MTKQLNTNQLDRLAEIKEEILVLLGEALDLVRGTPEEQRANHWFATFCTALDKDNTQGSESTITSPIRTHWLGHSNSCLPCCSPA